MRSTTQALAIVAAAAGALTVGASRAHAHIIWYEFDLTAPQVVDPTASTAWGHCLIGYNHHSVRMYFDLVVHGITTDQLVGDGSIGEGIDIHVADIGFNGPQIINLGHHVIPPPFPGLEEGYLMEPTADGFHFQVISRFIDDPDDPEFPGDKWVENQDALYNLLWYLDIHTDAYPNGEIRGQVPSPGTIVLPALAGLIAVRRRRA